MAPKWFDHLFFILTAFWHNLLLTIDGSLERVFAGKLYESDAFCHGQNYDQWSVFEGDDKKPIFYCCAKFSSHRCAPL